MQYLPHQILKNISFHIPERYRREVSDTIIELNCFRMKWFCLGFVFIASIMAIIDFNTLIPDKKYDLHFYYLWFDAALLGIGGLFYVFFLASEKWFAGNLVVRDRIFFSASTALLLWCGSISALEHFTHNSVSTMIIGVIGLACAVFHRGRDIITIYGLSIAAFIVSKISFSETPVHFFLDHINLIPLVLFGWLLSRMMYASKLQTIVQQNEILMKNAQLAEEITIREKAEEELKAIHKELEKRVEDRTRELMMINKELIKEVNERKKIQNKLNHAQKMELIGTMASGIAHDLNNVLSGVNTYPELLLMDMAQDDPMRNHIEMIHQSGKKATDIIRDMLILARRGVRVEDPVCLNHTIKEYLDGPEFKSLTDIHKKMGVTTDLAGDIPLINGSRTHLSTAIMNIINNAAESMPDGGTITIKTEKVILDDSMQMCKVVKPGEYISLSIADNGVGIAPEDKDKIFEPFYTNKTMGKSGTGLGMAIVWGMVKDHKGYVDVKSKLNQGTTFVLYFPVQKSEQAELKETDEQIIADGNGEKILVVDDLEDQLFFAKTILEKYNYQVTCKQGGEAAVAYMKEHEADLVILDMNMDPGMNGIEAYKEIMRIHPGQRAIVASGFSSEELILEAEQQGIHTFIKKPYSVVNLNKAVKAELT